MTPDEMNSAVAQTQGFVFLEESIVKPDGTTVDCEFLTEEAVRAIYPDFGADLNAIHQAEQWLEANHPALCKQYANELRFVINPDGFVGDFRLIHATAPQRREAFLKAKGLWIE